MPFFAITGRLHGEDEDTSMTCFQPTVEAARQLFIDEQREIFDISAEDIAAGYENANVYITSVFKSKTMIEIV